MDISCAYNVFFRRIVIVLMDVVGMFHDAVCSYGVSMLHFWRECTFLLFSVSENPPRCHLGCLCRVYVYVNGILLEDTCIIQCICLHIQHSIEAVYRSVIGSANM